MVEVKVGGEIPVTVAVTGKSGKGPYWKVNVCAEKGYDKISVWATNPEEAGKIVGMAKVVGIQSVKLSAHQYQNKWYTDYTVNAKLAQGSTEAPDPFVDVAMSEQEELPFA